MLVVMIRPREEDKGAHSSDAPQSLLAMHYYGATQQAVPALHVQEIKTPVYK